MESNYSTDSSLFDFLSTQQPENMIPLSGGGMLGIFTLIIINFYCFQVVLLEDTNSTKAELHTSQHFNPKPMIILSFHPTPENSIDFCPSLASMWSHSQASHAKSGMVGVVKSDPHSTAVTTYTLLSITYL